MRTSHGQRRPVHDVTCMGGANRRRGTGPLLPPPRRPRPRHLPREPCNTQGGEREWGRGERPCGAERRRGADGDAWVRIYLLFDEASLPEGRAISSCRCTCRTPKHVRHKKLPRSVDFQKKNDVGFVCVGAGRDETRGSTCATGM